MAKVLANVLDRVDMRAIHAIILHHFMDPIRQFPNHDGILRVEIGQFNLWISESALLDGSLVVWVGGLGDGASFMEGGRIVEQLGEAGEEEVGARHGHMVDNDVENEVHPTSVQSAAKLFRATSGAKMGIQGIQFLRPVTGAHCKPGTHKKEMAYAPVIGFALGGRDWQRQGDPMASNPAPRIE